MEGGRGTPRPPSKRVIREHVRFARGKQERDEGGEIVSGRCTLTYLNPCDVSLLLQLNLTIPVPEYEGLVLTLLFLSDAPAFLPLFSKPDSRLYQYIYDKTFFPLSLQ